MVPWVLRGNVLHSWNLELRIAGSPCIALAHDWGSVQMNLWFSWLPPLLPLQDSNVFNGFHGPQASISTCLIFFLNVLELKHSRSSQFACLYHQSNMFHQNISNKSIRFSKIPKKKHRLHRPEVMAWQSHGPVMSKWTPKCSTWRSFAASSPCPRRLDADVK